MSITFAVAVYAIIWWIVLFTVLPFGVRTQEEDGEVVPGSEPSAPVAPRMLRTVIRTTIVATIVFLAFVGLRYSGIGLDDIPLPGPR